MQIFENLNIMEKFKVRVNTFDFLGLKINLLLLRLTGI